MGWKEQIQCDLKTAVRSGDIEALRELIRKGGDKICKNCDTYSIIMDAGENMEVIRLLVEEFHLPLEDTDNFGQTVLMNLTSHYGKLKVIEYLVSAGANLHARNVLGETALHVAARSWCLETFKFYQDSGIPMDSLDVYGRTVLHHAAASKSREILKYLLEGDWVPIDCKDRYGQTPLMLSSSYPNGCFKLLLDAGADTAAVDVIGRIALHRALGSTNNFTCLQKRCLSFGDGIDKKGQPAIIHALSFFRYSSDMPCVLELLLKGGANPDMRGKDGKTALDITLEEELQRETWLLLEAGASFSHYSKDVLNQILHAAASCYELVHRLLAQGADINGRYRPKHRKSTVNGHTRRCLEWAVSDCNSDTGPLTTDLSGHSPIFGNLCSPKTTKLLLDAGADVNFKDDNGCTPLQQAVYSCNRCYHSCGHYKVLEMLLNAGADPNIADKCGVTPLHSASNMRLSPMASQSIATLIRKYGSEKSILNARDHNGRTPLHYAVARGHFKIMKVLIDAGADVNAVDADGRTPIFMKYRGTYNEVPKLLIEAGADLTVRDKNGKSVLQVAFENCNNRLIYLLIREHAFLLDSGNVDKNGKTILHTAFEIADTYIIDLILQKNKALAECGKTGSSFLHCAIKKVISNQYYGNEATSDSYSIVEYILEKNLVPVDHQDEQGQTALQLAVHRNDCCVRILLEAGANPRVKDNQGKEPLHITASHGNAMIAEELIAAGADVTAKDDTGRIPLHWAAEAGSVEVMKLLLQKADQQTPRGIDVQDNDGCTPLLLAVRSEPAVKLLLSEGASVSIRNHSGRTALQAAIDCQNYQVIKLLLDAGSDLSGTEKESRVRITHLAVEAEDFQMLEDLISLGTNLEKCWWDPEHKTTLLHIAAKNSFKMVKHILGMQQNPDEWNNDGQTALHCAALSGCALTVKYLLDEGHIPIDQRDRNGKTSLMLVSSMRDWDSWTPRMMEFLIHEGADVKLRDNENRTALELALQSGVYCAAEILDLEEWVQM
ncbi:serine/threonine-protein phosphatase 6 regulatory ankyrin repeat subunit B-like [Schistocerca serialis cubense]|uniref:serine/threonine-protein phosphatase 6 regulatory ankyrin repeat subunit B-like n=1 Tax=Schistocerca serialis cubense TaxID=2023355 RepID=UPI00214E3DC5|nr:serine/threonine-protein phosphatase 6 regulatory ankyrin repeat subunit B-like [Schistocerca serialis cubense]XP_049941128.1 serine/threonine-protein phosphatase 6 regulatory ankyrin repeat subunit B-like [Schistocerca serialis cubense]XP_049941129.1 serine/threonine-protein phosphatase 6 regulatory ankyrin repeat subunit B-like [Schistocerca serialis cubense]XP_049941130.1 serine/threonine-protein phosphatase 6 regulatory ankyrin repeat subunit B-like [Schistocerca serialis cubense]